MAINIKNNIEQEKMRTAGRLASEILTMIDEHVKPGVTTKELDKICHNYIVNNQNTIPANLGYRGFPATICTSVNHVVCHGIPNEKRLKHGDIINIDVTVIKDDFHGDTSRMYLVGKTTKQGERIAEVAYECLCTDNRSLCGTSQREQKIEKKTKHKLSNSLIMNRDSNAYTFGFAAAMVVVVASVLAFTASSLKDLQQDNVRKEKMQNMNDSERKAYLLQKAQSN